MAHTTLCFRFFISKWDDDSDLRGYWEDYVRQAVWILSSKPGRERALYELVIQGPVWNMSEGGGSRGQGSSPLETDNRLCRKGQVKWAPIRDGSLAETTWGPRQGWGPVMLVALHGATLLVFTPLCGSGLAWDLLSSLACGSENSSVLTIPRAETPTRPAPPSDAWVNSGCWRSAEERNERVQWVPLPFKEISWESLSLLLMFRWLKPSHKATPSCEGSQATESSDWRCRHPE